MFNNILENVFPLQPVVERLRQNFLQIFHKPDSRNQTSLIIHFCPITTITSAVIPKICKFLHLDIFHKRTNIGSLFIFAGNLRNTPRIKKIAILEENPDYVYQLGEIVDTKKENEKKVNRRRCVDGRRSTRQEFLLLRLFLFSFILFLVLLRNRAEYRRGKEAKSSAGR